MHDTKTIGFRASPELYETMETVVKETSTQSISHYLRNLVMADLGRRRLDKRKLKATLPRSQWAGSRRTSFK